MPFTATLQAAAVQDQRQEESASLAFTAVGVSLSERHSYTQLLDEMHLSVPTDCPLITPLQPNLDVVNY